MRFPNFHPAFCEWERKVFKLVHLLKYIYEDISTFYSKTAILFSYLIYGNN